ncbi:MAG: hypothetical protein Q7T16_04905 [Candidatus Burarchaeum sp.]|nr:hypothetical protein [Candidatus Burarchaeum sp.]MDO8339969.1 hypothetical protein [Candidatus Burarchaeum sp.]
MNKIMGFFDGAGRLVPKERSVTFTVRELRKDGKLVESIGLTAVMMEQEMRGRTAHLADAVIIVPGDMHTFERFENMANRKKTDARGGGMAKAAGTGSVRCSLGKEFVFKMPDGRVVGKAASLTELSLLVRKAPLESVLYHTNGAHFSPWLDMIGMKSLAFSLKGVKGNNEETRQSLLKMLGA